MLPPTLLILLLSTASPILASPTPRPQGTGTGADSWASDPLAPQTWTDLKVDDFLATAATNNVQSLADSFGAPNFFCGLDSFCNAGQPCLPIRLPAWYAAVAMQNWNNYMNSLNTAITFASVTDVFPDPKDNITPLSNIANIFGSVLSLVPFTGPVSTASTALQSGLNFVLSRAKPPATTDNAVIKGGIFLGVSQNFTQADLQSAVIDAITMNALGMALQAQKIFVTRFFNRPSCEDDLENTLCAQNEGSDTFTSWSLVRRSGDANAASQTDIAKVLWNKYGMTKLQFLKGPMDCFDANGKAQLTNPFDKGLPTNAKAACVFNVLVCDIEVIAEW
ncbi:hypothetical protein K458DRAFT_447510 [Lentithecium fluviatile CBS 122367]|uniref:DUF7872 domain-containing protein n=1 Tax=Lentithecium fluviatile CBS 122367 TaxID=1168545 RepID=A0A6G1IDS8_9PLEO|nr:hypothetical protein K458DRAFT_447510 [Lentithecium fluviatile CBS 122367]